jgi:hypothetical protein
MAKAGGISAFVMVALTVLGLVTGGAIGSFLNLIALALFVFVLIALNANLNDHNYGGAGAFIWTILGLFVAVIVVAIVEVLALGPTQVARAAGADPMAMFAELGLRPSAWRVVLAIPSLLLLVCFLLLGVRLQDYGNVGGALWKGIGTVAIGATALVLGAVVLVIFADVAKVALLEFVGRVFRIVGAILFLAFWILLGIGLVRDQARPTTA